MSSLRVSSSSTGLGFVLGQLGRKKGATAPSLAPAGRWRTISATSTAAAPTPGDEGVDMEQRKQPLHDEAEHAGDDMHKITGDVMTHSFGEGYSTRSDEEGFGGVYGRNYPVFKRGTEVHPSHPEYDRSQGSEVKEKEKARNLRDEKDEKHAAK